ncbi:MAG: hypothetical protein KAT91_03870 [Candidatus Aenigmarchaeota archaeon]|nr:hypothetical protein [Candidatus Aenigmarchaeota archaeon]
MEDYVAPCELTKRIENILPKSKGKWYLASATPNEHILRYAFVTRDMIENPEKLSTSMWHTADLLYCLNTIPYSSHLIATKDAFFSKINHCFVPHNGIMVELEKEDGIPEYLNDILDELGIKITRIEKGQIISHLMSTCNIPAYYIEPLKN